MEPYEPEPDEYAERDHAQPDTRPARWRRMRRARENSRVNSRTGVTVYVPALDEMYVAERLPVSVAANYGVEVSKANIAVHVRRPRTHTYSQDMVIEPGSNIVLAIHGEERVVRVRDYTGYLEYEGQKVARAGILTLQRIPGFRVPYRAN